MSIKTNSKLLLTVFLAGSLSGYVNASQDDLLKEKAELLEEGSRLQITGAYNLLTAQIDAFQAAVESSTQSAAYQVSLLANNSILTTTVAGATNAAAFNAEMVVVTGLVTTALTTPNRTNILAVQTAVTTMQAGGINVLSGTATSTYSVSMILATLAQLQLNITNWLAFYPA